MAGQEDPLAVATIHLEADAGEAALLPLHLDVPADPAHELEFRLGGLRVGFRLLGAAADAGVQMELL